MNDEYASPSGDEPRPTRPGSRWAVQPGSADARSDRPQRRPAREIIKDVTSRPYVDDAPTRVTVRRPDVPLETRPRPRLDPDYGDKDKAAADRTVRGARRAPLLDESARVTPDLGEKRELTPLTAIRSSGRVLAGAGGVVLIVIATLIGGIIDFLFTDRLGLVTGVCLVLGAAAAALLTRKRDLLSIMVAPPLVYAAVAAVVLLMSSRPIRVTSIADVAISGFPAMALATGLAAIIGGVRLATSKVGERK